MLRRSKKSEGFIFVLHKPRIFGVAQGIGALGTVSDFSKGLFSRCAVRSDPDGFFCWPLLPPLERIKACWSSGDDYIREWPDVTREEFVARFGGVFEHSAWVAERAYDAGPPERLTADAVHQALCAAFRSASEAERLGVLRAHPDLAGKLAIAGELTEDSRKEQAGAGLDRLSAEEHARFSALNSAYVEKFGFPFIIAVKGLNKGDILSAFETRIDNNRDAEFSTASAQVERIALLRLTSMLPEGNTHG